MTMQAYNKALQHLSLDPIDDINPKASASPYQSYDFAFNRKVADWVDTELAAPQTKNEHHESDAEPQIQIQLETLSLPRALLYKSQFIGFESIKQLQFDTTCIYKGLHFVSNNLDSHGKQIILRPPDHLLPWLKKPTNPHPTPSKTGKLHFPSSTFGQQYGYSDIDLVNTTLKSDFETVDGAEYEPLWNWAEEQKGVLSEEWTVEFWGLDWWSCQEVLRDREWFEGVVETLRDVWERMRDEVGNRVREGGGGGGGGPSGAGGGGDEMVGKKRKAEAGGPDGKGDVGPKKKKAAVKETDEHESLKLARSNLAAAAAIGGGRQYDWMHPGAGAGGKGVASHPATTKQKGLGGGGRGRGVGRGGKLRGPGAAGPGPVDTGPRDITPRDLLFCLEKERGVAKSAILKGWFNVK
ncbi:hypothetical protein HDV00_001160 [Rhizophlyctis rosea]|nr:hypothetical protein HDV00_001160 [Rhizophlyctis rosea]